MTANQEQREDLDKLESDIEKLIDAHMKAHGKCGFQIEVATMLTRLETKKGYYVGTKVTVHSII